MCFLENIESGRDVLWKKKILWISNFQKKQISNHRMSNASDFVLRTLKPVRLRANCLQFVNFWIEIFIACQILNLKFLQPVIFWIEMFTTHQIFKWIWIKKFDLSLKVCVQKVNLLAILQRKNVKVSFLVRPESKEGVFGKKTNFESKFSKRINFWINFLTTRTNLN